jgi:hypothetical protein
LKRLGAVLVMVLILGACSTASVDRTQARRVVGSESGVRVDAEIFGEVMRTGSPVAITYEITNGRSERIAVADIIPVTSWDPEELLVTVDIGSEVPGEVMLPRLVAIEPGETKVFSTSARIAFPMPMPPGQQPPAVALRLKVNFLGDVEPFRALVGITEKAVADRALADALFPLWIERNEALYTGTVTLRWSTSQDPAIAPIQRSPRTGRF